MSDNMTRLIVVGCGSSKQDLESGETVPACELYNSGFFTVKENYAEALADDWKILSAEFGLIDPDEELPYYDTSMDDLDSDERDALASVVRSDLEEWIESHADSIEDDVTVEFLLGKKYREPLESRGAFAVMANIEHPLQQDELGGMGDQMSWMNAQHEEGDDGS